MIIGGVALLTAASKLKWLKPVETGWVGAGMIFCATGWVLTAIINITRADFPNPLQAIIIALALTAPLVLSLIVGLVFLVKRSK